MFSSPMLQTSSTTQSHPPTPKAQTPQDYKKYSPIPNNSKNVVAALGFTGAFLIVASTVMLIASIASMIIPFIAVAAALLVIGAITVTVVTRNKKLYELFFHVIGICKFRTNLKEKNLGNCDLIGQREGFQKEDTSKPKKYATAMYVAPNGNTLALMATPDKEKVNWLANNNFGSIISMQEPWEECDPSLDFQSAVPARVMVDSNENIRKGKFADPKDPSKDLPITQYMIATPDRLTINFKDLDNAVEFVKSGLAKGNVAVHCKSGVGRSAKVIAAFYIKHLGLSVEEAINRVKNGRRVVALSKIKELPNLYQYAAHLLKEELKNSRLCDKEKLKKILFLRAEMNKHVLNYYTEMGIKQGDKLRERLDKLYKESGLESIASLYLSRNG
jgi:protein-tyrosine phosphatase